MICSNCKSEIQDNSMFCNHCGAKTETLTCSNIVCGKTGLPIEAQFCPDCGTQLNNKNQTKVDASFKEKKIITLVFQGSFPKFKIFLNGCLFCRVTAHNYFKVPIELKNDGIVYLTTKIPLINIGYNFKTEQNFKIDPKKMSKTELHFQFNSFLSSFSLTN